MKKRNLLTLVLALVLVAALAVGGTLAYFTDSDDVNNTFTMGHVDIDLQESNDGVNWENNGLTYNNVLPGNTEKKMAQVVVGENSEDCYVMVSVSIAANEGSTISPENIDKLYKAVKDQIDENMWDVTPPTGGPLQCVYSVKSGTAEPDRIASKNDVLPLFNEIVIPEEFGNEMADQSFTITLNAFAIQSANVDYANVTWNPNDFEKYPVELSS